MFEKKKRKKKSSLKVLRRMGMECRVYAVAVPKKERSVEGDYRKAGKERERKEEESRFKGLPPKS